MSTPDELDRMIDAGAALLGVPIAPEWRAAIRMNLDVSLRHAANVEGLALDDEAEPAPVFSA